MICKMIRKEWKSGSNEGAVKAHIRILKEGLKETLVSEEGNSMRSRNEEAGYLEIQI